MTHGGAQHAGVEPALQGAHCGLGEILGGVEAQRAVRVIAMLDATWLYHATVPDAVGHIRAFAIFWSRERSTAP